MGREAVLTGCGADSHRHVPSMPSSARSGDRGPLAEPVLRSLLIWTLALTADLLKHSEWSSTICE
jgi:hypothetical protein